MLVLTRKSGARLLMGDDIEVTILGVCGNQVRIGINAPKNIAVDREEIFLRKQQEREPPTDFSNKAPTERKPTITLKRPKLRLEKHTWEE